MKILEVKGERNFHATCRFGGRSQRTATSENEIGAFLEYGGDQLGIYSISRQGSETDAKARGANARRKPSCRA
jgi:hypothetical protein